DAPDSKSQRARMRAFFTTWRERLTQLDFGKLSQEGKVDYVLLDNHLRYQLELMAREEVQAQEMAPLMPFADRLLELHDARRDLVTVNGQAAARTLAEVTRVVDSMRTLLEPAAGGARAAGDSARPRSSAPKVSRTVGNRAADQLDQIRNVVSQWYRFSSGYDPLFTWWAANPYQKLDESMRRYAQTIRHRIGMVVPAVVAVVVAVVPRPWPQPQPQHRRRVMPHRLMSPLLAIPLAPKDSPSIYATP
ncbi:MAG: hypothetical protein ACOVSI_16335, partial [Gemmatimonas sp.]